MALRKSRRQFVMNSASVAALYASGLIPSPAAVVAAPLPAPAPTIEDKALAAKIAAHECQVAARPDDDAAVSARIAYLALLVAQREYAADHGDTDAADTLARLNRCLDLPIDCLDGTFGRRFGRV